MILSLSILSIVPVVMSIYIENKILIVMFVSLSGLFLSSLYPLIINLSIFSYKRYKNFIIPLLIMIGGTGGIFSPWLIGFVFGKYSMFLGMNLIIIFQFLLFVSISIFLLSNGKSRKLFFKKS